MSSMPEIPSLIDGTMKGINGTDTITHGRPYLMVPRPFVHCFVNLVCHLGRKLQACSRAGCIHGICYKSQNVIWMLAPDMARQGQCVVVSMFDIVSTHQRVIGSSLHYNLRF